jgi:RNA polymerase sigma-70 factor (ECF subfamily)
VKLFEDDCRRLRSWKGESSLSTWLFAVVRNLGRDYREKELTWIRRTEDDGGDGGESLRDDDMPTPEDELVVSQMESIIKGLLGSLEDMCRKIVDLRFMSDMSYKEIALAAGLTVSNVGVRLHRCLETLAHLMKRKFPDLFEDRFNFDL